MILIGTASCVGFIDKTEPLTGWQSDNNKKHMHRTIFDRLQIVRFFK